MSYRKNFNTRDQTSLRTLSPSKPEFRAVRFPNTPPTRLFATNERTATSPYYQSSGSACSMESAWSCPLPKRGSSPSSLFGNNSGSDSSKEREDSIHERESSERGGSDLDNNTPMKEEEEVWSEHKLRLQPLNEYHWVSKNRILIRRVELTKVLHRLQRTFRKASCQCEFRNDNRIYCHTIQDTDFVVSIWLVDKKKNKNNKKRGEQQQILIEVDRSSGDSIIFHGMYVPLVMNSLRGSGGDDDVNMDVEPAVVPSTDPMASLMHSSCCCHTIPPVSSCLLPPATELPDSTSCTEEALEIIESMLGSDRYDSRLLGLESLEVLTDPTKSSEATAQQVANVVLAKTQGGGSHRKIHQYVNSLALTGRFWQSYTTTTTTTGGGDEMSFSESILCPHHAYKALTVLAQAVNLISTEEDMRAFVQVTDPLPGVQSVVERLLEQLHQAQDLNTAYLATHILCALEHALHLGTDRINVQYVRNAQMVGSCSHAALAHASYRLLHELEASTPLST